MKAVLITKKSSQHLSQKEVDTSDFDSRSRTLKPIRLIGQVESVMTRHTSGGEDIFVLLGLANGNLLRGRWAAILGESLPNLGDVIRIEITPNDAVVKIRDSLLTGAASQSTDKYCHPIIHWRGIPDTYPLTLLGSLYDLTEQPEALDRLWGIIDRIPVPDLRQLLNELFAHSRFSMPFVQVAASHNHHHSHPGGLLIHSVECAEWVERVATGTLNSKESALAVVAALLHDFGKIETMGTSGFSQLVAHEVLTLALLEPALTKLQTQWPQGAYALRQMLSWSTFTEKFPTLPGALLVKMADQYSTALSAREKAFKAQPEHYYWARLTTSHSIQLFNRIN
ncbi:MAG: HD domain-containing protein [Methylococcales bacterium]